VTVYLVGAGPGDPGLLTVRAANLLARATTIVHDRLVEPSVLALAGPGARLIDVGKRPAGGRSTSQAEINQLLVEEGGRQQVVVRLKGGDPYVLGRGAEEALALEAAGIAYEVVPGISAALAAASAAGVPLTDRHLTSSFAVLSGHSLEERVGAEQDTSSVGDDWSLLGSSSATIVVLMGASNRHLVSERLLQAGRPPATPVVVVQRATTPAQSTIRTTLSQLAALEVEAPATIVVGAVAGLRLASYESRPLAGLTVVVTRAPEEAGEVAGLLAERGAAVVCLPARQTAAPADGGAALADAIGRLGSFAWVVLASPRAVEALWGGLRDARDLAGSKLAAAGMATARALFARGLRADLVAEPGSGEGAAAALLSHFPAPATLHRTAVLLPRAAGGGNQLAKGLAELGWTVEAVEAYRSVVPPADRSVLAAVNGADAVLFASPSAVTGFLQLAGTETIPQVVVTIGPTTSAAARAAGLEVAGEARRPGAQGLVDALVAAVRPA